MLRRYQHAKSIMRDHEFCTSVFTIHGTKDRLFEENLKVCGCCELSAELLESISQWKTIVSSCAGITLNPHIPSDPLEEPATLAFCMFLHVLYVSCVCLSAGCN
jgi:hypothetical protein